jgi:hypothetical protein
MRRKPSFSLVASVFNDISGCSRRRDKKRFPFVCPSVWAEVHNELLLTFRVRTLAVTMKQDQVDRAHTHTQSERRQFARRPKPDLGNSVFLYILYSPPRVLPHTHASMLQLIKHHRQYISGLRVW